MFGIGFFSQDVTSPPVSSATFAYSEYTGGFAYGFSDSKPYHYGGYGVSASSFYDLFIPITASAIIGSWTSLKIDINNTIWTGLPTNLTLKVRALPLGLPNGSASATDVVLASVTLTQGSTSASITINGTDIQNYLNGTLGTTIYLEYDTAYYAYYVGFDSLTFTIT